MRASKFSLFAAMLIPFALAGRRKWGEGVPQRA